MGRLSISPGKCIYTPSAPVRGRSTGAEQPLWACFKNTTFCICHARLLTLALKHFTFESIRTNVVNGKLTVNRGSNQNLESFRGKWTNAIFKAFHGSRARSTPGFHLEWVTIFVLTFVIARLTEETDQSVHDPMTICEWWTFDCCAISTNGVLFGRIQLHKKIAFYESYRSKKTPPCKLYNVFLWILLFSYLFRKHRRFKTAKPFKHTK